MLPPTHTHQILSPRILFSAAYRHRQERIRFPQLWALFISRPLCNVIDPPLLGVGGGDSKVASSLGCRNGQTSADGQLCDSIDPFPRQHPWGFASLSQQGRRPWDVLLLSSAVAALLVSDTVVQIEQLTPSALSFSNQKT